MRAIGQYIVVVPVKEEARSETGLLISQDERNKMRYGKAVVEATGSEVEGIEDGDTVYYDKRSAFSMLVEGKPFTIITSSSVVLVA